MFTRVVDTGDKTIATYKYWVYVVLSGQSPVTAGVQKSHRLQDLEDSFPNCEIRLIKGFPILDHALRFQKKNLHKVPTTVAVPVGFIPTAPKFRSGWCRICETTKSSKGLRHSCPKCITSVVRGPVGKENVYGLYDLNDKLLYIGVTKNPRQRADQHLAQKTFHYMKTIKTFQDRAEAERCEIAAIKKYLPPLNALVLDTPDTLESLDFGEVSTSVKPRRKISQYRGTAPRLDLGPLTVGVLEEEKWNLSK